MAGAISTIGGIASKVLPMAPTIIKGIGGVIGGIRNLFSGKKKESAQQQVGPQQYSNPGGFGGGIQQMYLGARDMYRQGRETFGHMRDTFRDTRDAFRGGDIEGGFGRIQQGIGQFGRDAGGMYNTGRGMYDTGRGMYQGGRQMIGDFAGGIGMDPRRMRRRAGGI